MNNSALFRVYKGVHLESLLSKLPGHHHHLCPSSGQGLQRMHGQTGPLSRGPRSHSTAPGGLGPSRDTCAHWTPAWSQGPLGMSPGGSAGRVGSGFQMGRSQGALEADLSSGHPLRPYDHQNMDPHRPGHLPGATWVVGERTGPQPPGWLLPLAVGGPWVHSANVLSLNPPQAAQWRGRLFPGHGERGDTWGHRRHSGCGAEGNRASPHCPAVSFLHLDSQPLWMALPLPSCSAPAPAPRPGAPSLPLWPWPQSAVCASQRRDWLRRGLKPPPQRQEPGRRFVPAETLPPAPVRTHAGARWSPQNPVSADTASAQLSPPRPGVQPRGWGGVSLSTGRGAAVGTPSGSRTVTGPSRGGLQLDSGSWWLDQPRGARPARGGGGRLGWTRGLGWRSHSPSGLPRAPARPALRPRLPQREQATSKDPVLSRSAP